MLPVRQHGHLPQGRGLQVPPRLRPRRRVDGVGRLAPHGRQLGRQEGGQEGEAEPPVRRGAGAARVERDVWVAARELRDAVGDPAGVGDDGSRLRAAGARRRPPGIPLPERARCAAGVRHAVPLGFDPPERQQGRPQDGRLRRREHAARGLHASALRRAEAAAEAVDEGEMPRRGGGGLRPPADSRDGLG